MLIRSDSTPGGVATPTPRLRVAYAKKRIGKMKLIPQKEGWINHYRKPFLWVTGLIFVGLWLFTDPLWSFSPYIFELSEGFGSLFLVAGVIGRIYSSLTIASHKNKEVVKTEMYSVVRHPLYFFSFFMIIGIGLLIGRAELLLYLMVFYWACFFPMILNEEKFLLKKFGKEYADYQKQVPMLFPNFSKWKAREVAEINLRLVKRTILDGSLVLFLFPIIEIVSYIKHLIL